MKKILVIGTSGSGKSTLANQLSKRLQVQFFPSDHFYWEPGWKVASPDKVRRRVRDVISKEEWILDGNFDDEHEFVWSQADCIIWLDYSFFTIVKQIVGRNLKWALIQETIWSDNQMTLQRAISGIRHAIKSYARKRNSYPFWLASLHGVKVYRFRTKQETEMWLQGLSSRSSEA